MSNNKKGLGRGLSELFQVFDDVDIEKSEVKQTPSVKIDLKEAIKENNGVREIDIRLISPNPNQPRKMFDETALKELADSIKLHGIIQPIVLNKQDDQYMIIAGERRWRAAQKCGLTTVPAIVKNYTEKQVKEISLIENLQREDLNPIEAARAIKQLMEEYGFTQEVVADRIGKSRPGVANLVRLLSLTPEVVDLVEKNRLSAGHAKCLVSLNSTTQFKFAMMSVDNKMTVRDLEKAIKDFLNPKAKRSTTISEQSIELKDLANEMQRAFATKVSILGNDNKGRIYIDYYSRDDLDRISDILELIKQKKLTLRDLKNYNKNFGDKE